MRIFFLLCSFVIPLCLNAQVGGGTSVDTTKSSRIIVELADNFRFVNTENEGIKYLNGNVRMYQDSTFMYCDTAILRGNQLTAYGNVVIIQNDTVNVFADSLIYNGNQKIATLYNNVILQSKTRELFSDYLIYDMNTKIGSYTQGALLKNEGKEIKSLQGKYFVNEETVRFYQNVTVTADDFKLWTDSLEYDSEEDVTYFLGPTRINQDSARIYCEDGYYDLTNEIAEFRENAQYIQGNKIATGQLIKYDAGQKLVVLAGNAKYEEDDVLAKGDTIKYYEITEDTRLIGNASYKDKERSVVGEFIEYNAKSESFSSEGRSTIVDSTTVLTANQINFSQESDFGIARGSVELVDTASKTTIYSEIMEYKKDENYSKAYNDDGSRPMMQSLIEGDSMFMKADTLISYELGDSTQKKSILNAFHDVKIYKSNFQAMCDSMSYNTTDSILSMYYDPVIWSDSSQFTADTIDIYLKNEQIYKVELKNKAFIINTEDSIFYNQIKGKLVEVFFENGAIDSMSVTGNAESVYFMLDENNAYIGMNKSVCSKMSFTFEESDLKDIFFYLDVNSNLIPMKDVNPSDTLDGFNWQPKIRPKNKNAL
ncbi:OstA-like protein [Portibacter marinus]|uniref:OstA-like protein n=1 Tax=Portibacter marinus TaxID=2898660 RepID=UPI001F24FECE|nr:OstA-like protein [Portibacter marinus]